MTVKVRTGGTIPRRSHKSRLEGRCNGNTTNRIHRKSTAGEIAAELTRRGIAPGQRVTIAIEPDEPDDWITKARRFARPKVIAEGWSDADIDRIIKEEREAVQPHVG